MIASSDLSPRSPRLGTPVLPAWVQQFRPAQVDAARQIVERFEAGVKVVILDAPTGAGKTLIAELVRRFLNVKALYTCTTKTLQDQVEEDFPYGRVLKGRANYKTYDDTDGVMFRDSRHPITAANCFKSFALPGACDRCWGRQANTDQEDGDEEGRFVHCPWCHPIQLCPYTVAKNAALTAELAIVNTSYLLAEANYVGSFTDRDLVIIDEADRLEDVLMSFIEWELPRQYMRRFNIEPPDRKTVVGSWVGWAKAQQQPGAPLVRHHKRLAMLVKNQGDNPDTETVMEERRVAKLLAGLAEVSKSLGDGSWLYDGYKDGRLIFRPIRVAASAPSKLWAHGKRFLLMSATVVAPAQMAFDLGLEPGEWDVVHVGSTFPIASRPVFVTPVASVTAKTKDEAWPKLVPAVRRIMDRYPGERVLVHTVSYALAGFLSSHLRSPRTMTYTDAKQREPVLKEFMSPERSDAVLLAPSLDRGVDLRDDLCRVIVIVKVPFPYLGDKQIAQRFHGSPGGKRWYSMQAARTVVQMTGRGMRHEGDWCHSYILDSQFGSNLWGKNRDMFPPWWTEALVWDTPRRV